VESPRSPRLSFRVLPDEDIQRIYHAALECLERTGVNVLNAEGRSLLAGAGARLDGVRVRIPARMIQDAVAAAPGGFRLWGRDPQKCLDVRPGQVYFGPSLTASYFIDPESGLRRRPTRQDVALAARVIDSLEQIDYCMGFALPQDVPAERAAVYEFAEMALNCSKPLMAWGYSLENMQEIYLIAAAVRGSEAALVERPLYALFALGLGPLVAPDAVIANVLWCAEKGIPVVYHGPGVAGASAPITGAGTLVVTLAGGLAGLAMAQLKRPGAPFCLGTVPAAMDPRTARPAYGGPEMSLYAAAFAEVAAHLNLPYMGVAGATESKTPDAQAAIESTVQVIFALLSGTSLPHDAGFLDCGDISSLEMLVMTDEIISLARRLMRGIQVNQETLALDLIDRVGPGGEYLSQVETAHKLRQEIWIPHLVDRQPWSEWERKGSASMKERIQARVREICQTHTPFPLPNNALETVQAILG
jgi:trimethylamine--corrinoid protein Co-methyltransferase